MNENEVFALSRVPLERERKKEEEEEEREIINNAHARALCLKKFACPFFAFHHQTKKHSRQAESIFELSKKVKRASSEREPHNNTTNNKQQQTTSQKKK